VIVTGSHDAELLADILDHEGLVSQEMVNQADQRRKESSKQPEGTGARLVHSAWLELNPSTRYLFAGPAGSEPIRVEFEKHCVVQGMTRLVWNRMKAELYRCYPHLALRGVRDDSSVARPARPSRPTGSGSKRQATPSPAARPAKAARSSPPIVTAPRSKPSPTRSDQAVGTEMHDPKQYLKRRLAKYFEWESEEKLFYGHVHSHRGADIFRIHYDDGDKEDLKWDALSQCFALYEEKKESATEYDPMLKHGSKKKKKH
jgi:hypothetical protein